MTRDEITKCVYEIMAKTLEVPLESVNKQTEIPPRLRFYALGHITANTGATLVFDYGSSLTAGQIINRVEEELKEATS